jgi:hypothetical protein
MRIRIAIIASTKSTWMILPKEKTKAPSSHPIKRITAMMYNRLFIGIYFKGLMYIIIHKTVCQLPAPKTRE